MPYNFLLFDIKSPKLMCLFPEEETFPIKTFLKSVYVELLWLLTAAVEN